MLEVCWNHAEIKEYKRKDSSILRHLFYREAASAIAASKMIFELHQPLDPAPTPGTSWRCSSNLLAAMLVCRVPSILDTISPTQLLVNLLFKSSSRFLCEQKGNCERQHKISLNGLCCRNHRVPNWPPSTAGKVLIPLLWATKLWIWICIFYQIRAVLPPGPAERYQSSWSSWTAPQGPHTATLSDNHSFTSMPFPLGNFFQPQAMRWTQQLNLS